MTKQLERILDIFSWTFIQGMESMDMLQCGTSNQYDHYQTIMLFIMLYHLREAWIKTGRGKRQ